MMNDFCYTEADYSIFEKEFKNRLPDEIIDAHVHIWNKDCLGIKESDYKYYRKYKPWTDFIYNEEFIIEDYLECTNQIFPYKKVTGMYFGLPFEKVIVEKTNAYIFDAASRLNEPFYYIPTQYENIYETEEKLQLLQRKGFVGFKPYPDLIEGRHGDISIYDMLNRSVLEFSEKNSLTIMLHIPKKERMHDEQNRQELKEIASTYPNVRFILAHVARAFIYHDVENLIDFLSNYDNIWFDTSCVNDPLVIEYLFRRFDSSKLVYGSDAPIAYYRGRDVAVNNKHYIVSNKLFPWGFGLVNEELADLTFVVYEELRAILHAFKVVYGLNEEKHIERFFFSNAKKILDERGC